MFINWIAATMGTYGLGFNSVNLGGDIYVTFVLTAFIEIPSYIFLVLVVDRLGRKPVLIFCQVCLTTLKFNSDSLEGAKCILNAFI